MIAFEVCLLSTGCGWVERKILYAPKPFPCPTHLTCDQVKGVHVENACFEACDGTRLHGWYVEPNTTAPKHIILFSHGRSGNVTSFDTELMEFVRRHEVAVLAYDYRGYGKSEGQPSECGLYQDARAARDWLVNRTDRPAEEIILMGRSLGAAVAIELAADDQAKALIVESGFTSFPDIIQHHTRNLLTGKRFESRYNSVEKIVGFSGPVLVSHSKDDRLIPFEHGARLAGAAICAERINFVELAGEHDAPISPEYTEQFDAFLATLPSELEKR